MTKNNKRASNEQQSQTDSTSADSTIEESVPSSESASLEETATDSVVDEALEEPSEPAPENSATQGETEILATPTELPVISADDPLDEPDDTIQAPATKTPEHGKHGAHAAQSDKPKHSKAKIAIKVLCVLFCLVALVWLAGAITFKFIAMPNTKLGTQDISLKPFSEIAASVATQADSYSTSVTSNDFTLKLAADDIDIAFNQDKYAQGLAEQQSDWLWPLHIVGEHVINEANGVSYNEDKLKQLVSSAAEVYNQTATQPTDATIAYVESEGAMAVVPEVLGTALDVDATCTYIGNALATLPSTIKLDDSCLKQAAVKSDDKNLATAVENANVFLKADIPLTLGSMDAGTVSKAQISEWIVLDENQNATLDETKLAEWVKNTIAAKFDTAGSARTYTRPDGKVVTVDATSSHWGNYYGWITDEATLVEQLAEAIKSGSTETIDIPTKQTANAVPDENGRDWGNRYIDCDLSEQYVRLYDDSGSCIWESACVTGCTNNGTVTPPGVYILNGYKQSGDVELRGSIDPATGEPEYISHVSYWMPFIDNSYAFHDASWRSSFGGSIYVYGGSHGCVNLPSGKAADLYSLCQVGDVVIVHW